MTLDQFRKELEKMVSGAARATKEDFADNCAALAHELEKTPPTDGSDAAQLAVAFREIQREMKRRFRRFDRRVRTLGEHLREPVTTEADRQADEERLRPRLFEP